MAKVGNEAKLILSLAEEQMKASDRLHHELKFREQPGNYPEKFRWQDALTLGYNMAVQEYQAILDTVISQLEG